MLLGVFGVVLQSCCWFSSAGQKGLVFILWVCFGPFLEIFLGVVFILKRVVFIPRRVLHFVIFLIFFFAVSFFCFLFFCSWTSRNELCDLGKRREHYSNMSNIIAAMFASSVLLLVRMPWEKHKVTQPMCPELVGSRNTYQPRPPGPGRWSGKVGLEGLTGR